MSNEIQKTDNKTQAYEMALIMNDLSGLTPAQRLAYIKAVCESLKINPLTQPFGFIAFKGGELKLYTKRDCTDQLRKRDHVSVGLPEKIDILDCIAFRVLVSTPQGRTDSAIGAVPSKGLSGLDLANAVMKAETKAKRRATLSICGLGLLDESEIDTIKDAKIVDENYIAPLATADRVAQKILDKQAAIDKQEAQVRYYYNTALIEDTDKRVELEEWFRASDCKQVAKNVFECTLDSKKLAHLKVAKPETEVAHATV